MERCPSCDELTAPEDFRMSVEDDELLCIRCVNYEENFQLQESQLKNDLLKEIIDKYRERLNKNSNGGQPKPVDIQFLATGSLKYKIPLSDIFKRLHLSNTQALSIMLSVPESDLTKE